MTKSWRINIDIIVLLTCIKAFFCTTTAIFMLLSTFLFMLKLLQLMMKSRVFHDSFNKAINLMLCINYTHILWAVDIPEGVNIPIK